MDLNVFITNSFVTVYTTGEIVNARILNPVDIPGAGNDPAESSITLSIQNNPS